MKKQVIFLFLLLFGFQTQAQGDQKVSLLFQDMTPLEIKLSYSNKELRKDTNDSTFIDTEMQYNTTATGRCFLFRCEHEVTFVVPNVIFHL